MKSNFQDCLQRVLKDEGGYSNDPNDSGGPTKYGITIGDVRKYIKRNATADDVKALTLDQAGVIYKERYWDALNCDALSSGVDYTCFDYGVNSGIGRPSAALKKFSTKKGADLINAINDERQAFLKRIGVGKNAGFLKGWTSRVARVRAYSLQLAKTNNVAGPSAGAAAVGVGIASTTDQTMWNHVVAHPYMSGIIGAAIATAVGFAAHAYVNSGK